VLTFRDDTIIAEIANLLSNEPFRRFYSYEVHAILQIKPVTAREALRTLWRQGWIGRDEDMRYGAVGEDLVRPWSLAKHRGTR
jgi:DNA-binding IclR family transcriptional regulator